MLQIANEHIILFFASFPGFPFFQGQVATLSTEPRTTHHREPKKRDKGEKGQESARATSLHLPADMLY
jgi:hypothetical protein